jgi:hypothetical protein
MDKRQAAGVINRNSPGNFANYNGQRDPFVHFTGEVGGGFDNEVGTGKAFALTFDTSTAVADQEVILFPSIAPSAGLLIAREGAVGGGATGFQPATFTGDPTSFTGLQNWVERFPSRVIGMQLSCSNQLQHGVAMDVYIKNPWRKAVEPRTIRFSDHSNEFKNQLTITTIKDGFQADAKTEVRLKLKAATTGTITFYFGATLDTPEALRAKAAASGAATL